MSYREGLIEKIKTYYNEHPDLRKKWIFGDDVNEHLSYQPLSTLEYIIEYFSRTLIEESDEYKLAIKKMNLYKEVFPEYFYWFEEDKKNTFFPDILLKIIKDMEDKISQKKGLTNFESTYFEFVKNSTLKDYDVKF